MPEIGVSRLEQLWAIEEIKTLKIHRRSTDVPPGAHTWRGESGWRIAAMRIERLGMRPIAKGHSGPSR
jgi:hypothetical protein